MTLENVTALLRKIGADLDPPRHRNQAMVKALCERLGIEPTKGGAK